jgi:hypothetical protein
VTQYRDYLEKNTTTLVAATKPFVEAVRSDEVDEAKSLYAAARIPYERIEPVTESFGGLDPRIDARENDVGGQRIRLPPDREGALGRSSLNRTRGSALPPRALPPCSEADQARERLAVSPSRTTSTGERCLLSSAASRACCSSEASLPIWVPKPPTSFAALARSRELTLTRGRRASAADTPPRRRA